jgi:hypothetical protein
MADLAERVMRVRLLLETLNEPYPAPRGALVSDHGPAPSRYVPCETCGRRGEVRVRGGWLLCLVCDGRGWKRRESGEPEWDGYVEMPLVAAAELPRELGPSKPTPEAVREESFGWERLRRSYDRHGSYKAVRVQLDWLSLEAPQRFRLVQTVLVDHEPRVLVPPMQRELGLGVLMVTRRMPSKIRVPPWLIEVSAAAEKRDSIEALAADGFTAGEIARKLDLSKESVRRKLKRNGVRSGLAGAPERAA